MKIGFHFYAVSFLLVACGGSTVSPPAATPPADKPPVVTGGTCAVLSGFDLGKLAGSCSGLGAVSSISESQCQQDLPQCSTADQAVLSSIFACQTALSACVPGAEAVFQGALTACYAQATALSASCQQAFSFPTLTPPVPVPPGGPDMGQTNVCAALSGFNLATLVGSCPSLGTVSATTESKCEKDLPQCSTADQAVLSSIFACQAALTACVPGAETVFATALDACSAQATALSASCQQAFSFPSLTPPVPVPPVPIPPPPPGLP